MQHWIIFDELTRANFQPSPAADIKVAWSYPHIYIKQQAGP